MTRVLAWRGCENNYTNCFMMTKTQAWPQMYRNNFLEKLNRIICFIF